MDALADNGSTKTFYRGTAALLVLFWTCQFATLTVQRHLMGQPDRGYLAPRALVALAGVLISLLLAFSFRRLGGSRLSVRLLAGIALAAGACMLHSLANYTIFQLFFGQGNEQSATWGDYGFAMIQWFWSYAAVAGLLLALTYSRELAERERRLAGLQRLTHGAQLRALRYQLNPHFMFNTLNSIAALIAKRANDTAEQMVEGLADFFRASLAVNPQDDIPLEEEVELQSLYLAIEKLRFPDRLFVSVALPDDLRDALVPSLILQPLAENVVRHAVANSTGPVRLSMAAKAEAGRLILSVANSAPDEAASVRRGTATGLTNVEARLRARFDGDYSFRAGPAADGGYAVELGMPLMRSAE
jgi:hypothetical protein